MLNVGTFDITLETQAYKACAHLIYSYNEELADMLLKQVALTALREGGITEPEDQDRLIRIRKYYSFDDDGSGLEIGHSLFLFARNALGYYYLSPNGDKSKHWCD